MTLSFLAGIEAMGDECDEAAGRGCAGDFGDRDRGRTDA
jgi:hypothetical protein